MSHPATFSPEAKRKFMLAMIRRARAQMQCKVLEIDEIGISLDLNMIDAEAAARWLAYIGVDSIINQEPWPTRIEVSAA